jgi:hypothetical protein
LHRLGSVSVVKGSVVLTARSSNAAESGQGHEGRAGQD